MIVHYPTPAEEDLAYWMLHSRKITQRIESLIEDIRQHPFSGLGKPEPLRFQ
jgi:toxin YoeB